MPVSPEMSDIMCKSIPHHLFVSRSYTRENNNCIRNEIIVGLKTNNCFLATDKINQAIFFNPHPGVGGGGLSRTRQVFKDSKETAAC